MRYALAIALWLTAGPVFAQGFTFDLGRHGPDYGERAERMDRDYSERWQPHRHARHFHGRRCIQWDEDEGTWRRVC